MTVAAFAVVLVALVWLMDRRDRRAHDERVRLLATFHAERHGILERAHDERVAVENARAKAAPDLAALIALVENLCQRVQAPEQAVHEHAVQAAAPSPEPVSMFSDEQYWESKDMLAERAMSEELEDVGAP